GTLGRGLVLARLLVGLGVSLIPALSERCGSAAGRVMLVPVSVRSREDGLGAGRVRRSIQRIGGRAPDGVVRHRAMCFQRGLVLVDLVEVVDVLVVLDLEDVETQASRLVPFGTERVHLDGLEKALAQLGLDAHLHPNRQHGNLLVLSDMTSPAPTVTWGSARRRGRSRPWTTVVHRTIRS